MEKRNLKRQTVLCLAICILVTACGEKEPSFVGFRQVGDKNIMMDTSKWGN